MSQRQMPMVGARIPHAWAAQLQEICQQTGKCESEVVREAIAQYLGQVEPESIASMAKRLAALERQYKKLAQLI